MKSRVLPLVLGGAVAVCLAVLALAWWSSAPAHRGLPEPGGGESTAYAASDGPLAPVRADRPAAETPEEAATRIALAGEEPAAAVAQVEYELRMADERALPGARALLRRGDEILGTAKADRDGVVRFDAREGGAELIVVPGHAPVATRDVPTAAGRHRVTLERGVAVSGRLRASGSIPLGGVELTLTSDRPMFDDAGWSEAVREALELEDRDKLRLSTLTGESGLFEFTGLAMPWSGRLTLGDTHELVAVSAGAWERGSSSVQLDDPLEGLVLDVVVIPLATGRVVASAGGSGVPGASVEASLVFQAPPGEEQLQASFEGRADDDGRFALPIRRRGGSYDGNPAVPRVWPRLLQANLTLDGGPEVPRRRLELSGETLPAGFDFGELVLERGSTLTFVVVDGQDAPLAGAVGRLDGERSEPTGEDGRGTLVYAPGGTRPMSVSLAGYKDARVSLSAEQTGELRVPMQRTTRLSVTVRDPAGTPVSGAQVDAVWPNSQPQGGGRRRENSVVGRTSDAEGVAVLNDLPPSVEVRLQVRDSMDATLAEQSIVLEPEEWRSVELATTRPWLTFEGIVRDEHGLALADVNVSFTDRAGRNRANVSARTDADGRFAFHGLSGPIGQLRLRKSGFATLTLADFQIPPPGVVAALRLERGLRLSLRIVDERGAPVRGDNLRLEIPGERPIEGRRRGENEWEFASLPRTSVVAIANVAGREYRQDVEPLNGNQDVRVPVHGAVEVLVRLEPLATEQPVRISLRSRDDRRVHLVQNAPRDLVVARVFSPVLPGEYQVTVSQLVMENQRGSWVNLGATESVSVQAAQQARVELSR